MKLPIPFYGVMGLLLMLFGTAALVFQLQPAGYWVTPVMWTGYIVFLDALVKQLKGKSLIIGRPKELGFMAVLSALVWWGFEGYNLRTENWRYLNRPREWWVRQIGYWWSFATIIPGVFLTAKALTCWKKLALLKVEASPVKQWMLKSMIVAGAIFVLVPLVAPREFAHGMAAMVWTGYVFLLDPINYRLGAPSLIGDLEKGRVGRLVTLGLAGFICGILWELWNFWAMTKWVYDVPLLGDIKVFEMPVVGYLGFPAFALELFVIYNFVGKILKLPAAEFTEPLCT